MKTVYIEYRNKTENKMKTEQGRIMRVDIHWPILGNGSKLMNWSQIIKEEYDSYNLHTLTLTCKTYNKY